MARTDKQGGGKSWIFWGAGLLVVILVVIVGLLTIPTGSNEAEEPDEGLNAEGPDPSAQPVEPEEPSETDGETPERCEDMDADDSFPTEAPEFTWEDFEGSGGFAVPVSEEHGPAVQEDGFWRCFSQTPSGAAFAAQILFLDFVVSREYEAAIDSPGAREILAQGEGDDPEEYYDGVLVRGFRIVDSSDEEATVQVWQSVPEMSADGAYELTLLWDEEANDWRLDLASGDAPFTMLDNTADFTEWR
ncbi:hypothetical protein BCL67_1432 [Nesterenkonia sandarakina]|uniref:DUF8175 domain-containing protein n=1 Tax=Nesterenkonia sandarakina TaxID=272918 RepID=A0A2T0YAB7_9MICC|nr:hypothetical protein BCL67_1432 [Nesterenkonia sandarakina]